MGGGTGELEMKLKAQPQLTPWGLRGKKTSKENTGHNSRNGKGMDYCIVKQYGFKRMVMKNPS